MPGAGSKAARRGLPSVSVPVLSNATKVIGSGSLDKTESM
jgi:hypothetical protein